jgi:hypothetical protein
MGQRLQKLLTIGIGAWDGENFGIEELSEDLEELGYTEDVINGKKAIYLL